VPDPSLQALKFGDRFQVRAESGTGGMGTVYRAADLLTGQDVALKVLHVKQGASAERFNQEAALLADLAHPAIVRYVDHGVTPGGDHYLAMEWLEGETLDARLSRGPLRILETIRLGRRVLEGLAVAHRKGIIHRDLKPANLFLPQGDLGQVKLLDFGIARRVFDTRRITMTGSALGTPTYMSPEQVRGSRSIDARSDIFSLGSLLYECLTGAPPFEGDAPMAVLAKICVDEPVAVATRQPDLPAPLSATLERMLAKDPERRPASAADLAAELGALIEQLTEAGLSTGEIARHTTRRPGAPHLATVEQRVVSAILVARPRGEGADATSVVSTWDVPANITRHSVTEVFDEATFAKIQQTIIPFGARADRFLGTSMLVTLSGQGTPTDHATQAARCALKLKAMLPRAAFAVTTGRAVVDGQLPLGEVIDRASALIIAEAAGAIRVDEVTAGLLESRFELDGATEKHLLFEKGLTEAPRTVLGKEIPCVGRDRELGTLMGLWEECTSEPVARTVLVTAAAGAGKSRVRHELLDRIQFAGEAFELLVGRGDALRAGAPFAMLAPALRAAAGLVGGEPPAIACKRLLAHVGRHVPADKARRVAAFIGEIADVPFPDDDLPALRAAREDPRLMSDQTLAAWLDYLEAACQNQPVLLVLEDLHWGDAPTVQFVDAALRTLRERPLMVLAFARPEVDDKFPNLWIERDLQRISLPPLTPRSAQKLVKAAVADLGVDQVAWIVERADGNPFYLEELIRAVGAGAGNQALPGTVIGMVQARFDALGADAKRVLRAAAVFGQTFRSAGVKQLLGGDEDRSLDQWLDILVQKEVLFSRQAADTKELVFRHALLQEAAYDMLTAEDRVLGHRLAGEYLEAAGEREAILLVEHYERGAEPLKAAHWCRFAAEQALDANDLGAVIERTARSVRLGVSGEALGAVRVAEAQAHFWLGEYREAETCGKESWSILTGPAQLRALRVIISAQGMQAKFEDVQDQATQLRQGEVDLGSVGAWLDCLVYAGGYLLPGGFFDAATGIIGEVEKHASYLEPPSRARLDGMKGLRAWQEGNQSEALARFTAALQGYELLGDVRSRTEMLANLGGTLADLGLIEEAEERLADSLSIAERMQLRFISATVMMNLSLIRALRGRFDEAAATGERALTLARKQGDPRVEGGTRVYLALGASLRGEPQTAEVHARAATELLASVPPTLPLALAALSQALLAQERREDAIHYARQAYRLLEEHGRVEDGEAVIRLSFARSLAALGQVDEAASVLRAARARLMERAHAITNPAWREAFLSRPPSHAEVIAASQALEEGRPIA
jgi:serine/threonine protein kinase/tetratricopeptide (TPR) repeat protein